MFAHAPRNAAPRGRSISHVAAVADVLSAAGLIWAHIVGAENHAVLFGHERFLVVSHPVGQRLGLAHRRIERVRGALANDRDDDRSDSPRITFCSLSDIHRPRLKIRTLCPQWVISRHCAVSVGCPLYPRKRTLPESVGMSALCQKQTLAC